VKREPPPVRGGRRGRATRRLDPASPCLNCGDPTRGEYCPSCGQRKVDVHVSIRTMVAETLEDELFVDRRLPRTLLALLFRPGRLTVEYVNGRVVRYIRPFRLYLITSVLFFLLLSFATLRFVRGIGDDSTPPPAATDAVAAATGEAATAGAVAGLEAALDAVRHQLDSPDLPPATRDSLRLVRNEITRQLAALSPRPGDPPAAAAEPEAGSPDPETTAAQADPAAADGAASTGGGPAARRGWSLEGGTVRLGHPALDSLATARIQELGRMETRQAAERLLGNFLGYIPTLMFLLLPVFALVLKALYVRRGRYYAEHFVFLLHTHAFLYLMFMVLLGVVLLGWVRGWVVTGIFGWIAVYVFLAMRHVYGQQRLKTLVKMWTLGWAYFWVLATALPVAVLVTILLL
jgi:hypothetical protein